MVARHMHPEGHFPNIFRENNKTPKEVHDELKSKIPPDEYHKINHGAEKTAQQILKTLHDSGHQGIEHKEKYHINHHETSVAWASNPTDYKKLMDNYGTEDKSSKSNADIVITHHPKNGQVNHHGISLKYSSRIPTESGPGLKNLEKHINDHNGTLQEISNKSNEKIHKIIKEPSRDKARAIFKSLPKDSEISQKIQDESVKATTKITKIYHRGLKRAENETHENHQKRLRKTISNLSTVDREHTYTHYRARYNPERDTVKISDPVKIHKKIMSAVKTIIPVHSGTSVHFNGITHEGNEIHLGTLNVKRRDSPLSNIQGSYKLGKIYH
jgi:hypothetical protein